jgi:thiamine biosynthesis lipoprotein|tara:strand:- start:240 stop:1232 length:993 start_codon:yes stop_codon:yes gene_type:complete
LKNKTFYFLIIICLGFFSSLFSQKIFSESFVLMGSAFDLTVVAENKEKASNYIEQAKNEIVRIEKLISSWDKNSETAKINSNSGIEAVKVSKELFDLIDRSQRISKITSGAFDITFAAIDRIWDFDGGESQMPSFEVIQNSISKIGFRKLELNKKESTVFLPEKGMKIGFGGIGKGYAADRAKELLINKGVKGGIINASGDMNTWGNQPDGSPWTVGIVNPMNKEKVFSWFSLEHDAVVTSGNYEKFTLIDGERFSHIIDPRTGIPSKGILSSTIFANKAELADALATATFVMGVESGMFLIDQLPNIEAILIDDKGVIYKSKNIEIEKN